MSGVDISLRSIVDALQGGAALVAEERARAYLTKMPGDRSGMTLLGLSLQAQDRADLAVEVHRELTRLFPAEPAEWNNLGTLLRECGKTDEAETAYRIGLGLAPTDFSLLLNIGFLFMDKADPAVARDFLLRAHEADPNSVEARVHAALLSVECGDNPIAQDLLRNWKQWPQVTPDLYLDLGWALSLIGSIGDGEDLLRLALNHPQDALRARARLVVMLERSNRLVEARELARSLPAPETPLPPDLRNDIVSAHTAMAVRHADPQMARTMLEGLLLHEQTEQVRANILFLLARICDRLDDRPAAMAALDVAHIAQAKLAARLEPEIAVPDYEPLKRAARYVSAEQFQAWPGRSAPPVAQSPIFIVGFPRSGTTMLEQILDAHPSLDSMDEQAFLQEQVDRMTSWGLTYPEGLSQLSDAQCDELRSLYWKLVGNTGCWSPGKRLVDKNPLNLLRLPVIARLFPNAPIILALRHPCDVLLSCYMQNFRSPAFALMCSSLQTLAKGYVNAMRFWIHHAEIMRPNTLILRYEDLLDDFPGHVSRIAAFLDLDQTDTMLTFHEHAQGKGYISTPSYSQVVQPPNKKAVGRWRRYQDSFEPVIPVLAPIMEHWGYAV
jgi:tetratricopeptide (TPR) repeat protein